MTMTPKHMALSAGLLLAWPATSPAMVTDGAAEMRQYVHARLADSRGMPDDAATSYARLLAGSPGDKLLALRAYRQALAAGNFKLAAQAAHQLDKLAALPADAVLMLLAEAVAAQDWRRAVTTIDRLQREQIFSFLVPVMRGWVAVGQGNRDPARMIANATQSQLAGAYARDHSLLIRLAAGRPDALAELRQLIAAKDSRAVRLQLAAAAILSKRGDVAGASSIVEGNGPELASARAVLATGKPLPGAIDTPALGLSELLAQLAVDVKGDGRSPVSLQLARLANYLGPDNSAATIATADLLGSNGYREAAVALLARISPDDPLAEAANQERSGLLLAMGNREGALADARKLAARPGANAAAFVDLAGILSDLNRPAEAAEAYQRAIDLDKAQGRPRWVHLFLKAGALDRAGDWASAKELLRQANSVDPGQAVVLNYLGYGMLDHGEDIAEAQSYIERASALDPNDAAIADSLGWLYYRRGNYAGAIAALERAVAGDPGQPVMNEHLGDAYWAVGRRIEARYAWRAALVQAEKTDLERINRKIADGSGALPALTAK